MAGSVFLTGASAGLGEGMARAFARRGRPLALAARRKDRLDALAQELRRAGSPLVTTHALDVTEYDTVPGVVAEAAAAHDGLDVVVANSGIATAGSAGRGAFPAQRRVIETNLLGAMATVDAAVELFLRQGQGHVVAVTSVAAVRGLPGQGAYSASKSGLARYLEAVRAELAGTAIRVTDLAPGFIDTELNRHLKSRPFVVSAAAGTEAMVALVESGTDFAYVPRWPWTLLAQALKVLPTSLVSPGR